MRRNSFIPLGLPILSDSVLVKTHVEYEHILRLLDISLSPGLGDVKRQVSEALDEIEKELSARGLTDYASHTETYRFGVNPTLPPQTTKGAPQNGRPAQPAH